MTVRVVLADDHAILREGLRLVLARREDLEVVAEADDGREAVELVRELRPDVVVMNIAMADLSGMEATRQILAHNPDVKVIALSAYADRRYVLGMLDAGAKAYVLKANAGDELIRAIEAALAGKRYLTPEAADTVVDSYTRRLFPTDDSAATELGPREREVLQLLAEGHNSPSIARALHISVRTVEAHRRNIMRRLDLHSIAELTKYAVREGLTELER